MTPPVGATAERCTHAVPPSDEAAHCELQTISSAQPAHSHSNLPAGSGGTHTPSTDLHTNPGWRELVSQLGSESSFCKIYIFSVFTPTPEGSAVHLWSSKDGSVCFYIQRTVCVTVCATGSIVSDSASSSAAVQSVHGSPVAPEHRNGLHILRHPLTKSVNPHLAPTHLAAPGWMAADKNHEMRDVILYVKRCALVHALSN